jgi:hypothetical protein
VLTQLVFATKSSGQQHGQHGENDVLFHGKTILKKLGVLALWHVSGETADTPKRQLAKTPI